MGHKCHRGLRIVDQTAGKPLHRDKTDAVFAAGFYELQLLLSCQIAERELNGLIETGLCDFHSNADLVRRAADVMNEPQLLRLEHRLIHPCAVPRLVALSHLMKLIDVDIRRLHLLERRVQILPEGIRSFGGCLRRDENVFAGRPYVSVVQVLIRNLIRTLSRSSICPAECRADLLF